MHCEDFLPLIEKLADGEATAAEKRAAQGHLKDCADCREQLRFLEALPAAARQALPIEPPEAYWDALPQKVMARIASMEKGRENAVRPGWFSGVVSWPGLRWAGALVAALVAAAVGLHVLDAPFSSMPSSRDVVQAPSESSLSKDLQSGKEKQLAVEGLEESERESARSAVSGPPASPPLQTEQRAPRTEPARDSGQPDPADGAPLPGPGTPVVTLQGEERFVRDEPSSGDRVEALQKERDRVELDDVEPGEPDNAVAFESGRRVESSARRQGARDAQSGQSGEAGRAAPAPVGARVLQTRPDPEAAEPPVRADAPTEDGRSAGEDYRELVERYPLKRAESAPVSEAAPDEKARECADWRRLVERHGGTEEGTSARYRLALCSIALYDLQPSDPHRRQAVEDGQAYLAAEPNGDKADTIRRGLERMER